jgi:hypothetical protein
LKDQGKTWIKKSIPNLSDSSFMETPFDGACLAVFGRVESAGENVVLASNNSGETWTNASLPLPADAATTNHGVANLKMSTAGKSMIAFSEWDNSFR